MEAKKSDFNVYRNCVAQVCKDLINVHLAMGIWLMPHPLAEQSSIRKVTNETSG
jgi:hypothetical protein